MIPFWLQRRTPSALVALLTALLVATPQASASADGASLYQQYCQACHESGVGEAPSVAALRLFPQARLLEVMTTGVMQPQASALSASQRQSIAQYLGQPDGEAEGSVSGQCTPAQREGLSLHGKTLWQGWGADERNTRHIAAGGSDITPENVASLELKWAFGIPGGSRARSQPAVAGDYVFFGTQDGTVFALSLHSGCELWRHTVAAEVRHAISIVADAQSDGISLLFGDFKGTVYSLDATTGALRWTQSVSEHPATTLTGSPKVYDGTAYVPLSSLEVVYSRDREYDCCTFSGGIAALDVESGAIKWRTDLLPPAKRVGRNRADTADVYAPSGAPVWNSPTIDARRGLLYFGTGESYTAPASPLSDAIVALRMSDGEVAWVQQLTADDAWNASCGWEDEANCPEPMGPDFDFGAPPILLPLPDGSEVLVAGQKSGMVYGLDPARKGALLWQQRVGQGGFNGGIHWGMTTDGDWLYVPVSDSPSNNIGVMGPPQPGMVALDPATGDLRWRRDEPLKPCESFDYRCYPSLSAAASSTAGLVFAGGLDGVMHAYGAENGAERWRFDTLRTFDTVNGVHGFGGSIDSDGAVLLGPYLLINSGYDKFGEIPGNVLLVFGPAEGQVQ